MNKNLKFFAGFHVIFFMGMWISKTVHPVHFEHAHALQNFGISYSAMAAAGYFSFLIGHYCDRLGYRSTLAIGCVLYSLGLFLRVFPESAIISLLSGVSAGVGASTTITSVRVWLLQISDENSRARLLGVKGSGAALGSAIGCSVAGILAGKWLSISTETVLEIAAGLILLLSLLTFLITPAPAHESISSKDKSSLFEFFLEKKIIAVWATSTGVFAGFYVSFISPYLPIIMKSKGFDMTAVGISTGLLFLIRFFLDPIIGRFIQDRKENSFVIYIAAEFAVLITTAAFLSPFNQHAFVLFLILRSVGLGFSTIAEDATWFKVFPQKSLGLCFGLNQSGFFLGDFLGGLVNGKLYSAMGLQGCAVAAMAVMIINAAVFSMFLANHKRQSAIQKFEVNYSPQAPPA
ncbi:MFS transporter [Bdellovibrio sp. HCB185ZH]|uniref:MFS transporter n=1 Tax=Bdellovibrio sp. HCB185ZH TaxID=3394235 RepID=UPI0039A6258F